MEITERIKLPGRIRNDELLYLISYMLFITLMILRTSMYAKYFPDKVYKFMILGFLLLVAGAEYVRNRYTVRTIISVTVLVLMTLMIHRVAMFITAASLYYIYGAREYSFRRIAKISAVLTFGLVGFIILSSKVGIIPNYVMDEYGKRPREFLGFSYALYASAYFFNIIALDMYINKHKISLLRLLFYTVVNVWIFRLTDSRLSFLFNMLLVGTAIIMKGFGRRSKRVREPLYKVCGTVVSFSYVIGTVLTLFIYSRFKNEGWQKKIDILLSGRLRFGKKSYDLYGIKLLGQKIEWVGNGVGEDGKKAIGDYLYVDNLYLQFLQFYGVILVLILLAAVTFAMLRLVKYRNTFLLYMFMIIAVHAMLDDLVIHLWYNTFWLILGGLLCNPREIRDHLEYNRNMIGED